MERFKSLLRDTWWLWLAFVGLGLILGIFDPVFLVALPISAFAFIYFGFMRYDEDGNAKGDSE